MARQVAEKGTSKNDWSMFFTGVVFVILGFLLFLFPYISIQTLAIVAGIVLIAAGAYDIYTFYRLHKTGQSSGLMIVNAICDFILGILFLANPVITSEIMIMVLGWFVAIYGVFSVVSGFKMRGVGAAWGLLILNGIVSVLCGLMFVFMPATFIWFLAIFCIMRGVTVATFAIVGPKSIPYI